jgi:hypothetical protein
MSPINYEEVKSVIERSGSVNNFQIFCETGTFRGYTVENILPYFSKVYSIELNEDFYMYCKSKFKNQPKVTILHGDSSIVLDEINFNQPTVFFLDGHWSGYDTAKGTKDCPLLEELEIINKNAKCETLIIIDDSRLFGKNSLYQSDYPDWTEITVDNILNILKDRNVYYEDVEDRFSILLKKI